MDDPVEVALVELRARLRLGRATLRQDVPGPYPYPMTHEILGEGATSVADRVIDAGSSPTLSVILRERSLVVVDDCRTRAQEDPDFDDDGFRAMLDSYGGLASYVAVPIFDGERLHGIIALHHLGEPRAWTEEEVELAAQAGERIRNLVVTTNEAGGSA